MLRRRIAELRVSLDGAERFVGGEFHVSGLSNINWGHIPALRRIYAIEVPATNGRRMERSFELPEPPTFSAPRRGLYRGGAGRVDIVDLLGLARVSMTVPGTLEWRVLPHPKTRESEIAETRRGREDGVRSGPLLRNDELLEVRAYHAGDDPRHLNWKLFAHTGDLMLRIGEEVPPPSSQRLVVLIPGSTAELYRDRLVEVFFSMCRAHVDAGLDCRWLLPGMTTGKPFDADELLRALSEYRGGEVTFPPPGSNCLYVVSAAADPGVIGASGANRASFCIVAPPVRNIEDPHPLKGLFFQREGDDETRVFEENQGISFTTWRSYGVPASPIPTTSGSSELSPLTRGTAFILRSLALLLPLAIYRAQVPDFASIQGLLIAWTLGLASAVALSRLRTVIGMASIAIAPWLFRGLFQLYFALQRLIFEDPRIASLGLLFDQEFLPVLPVFYVVAASSLFVIQRPRSFWLDAALQALLVAVLMWNQENYQVDVVPHPLYIAVAVTLFVLLQLGSGVMVHPGRRRAVLGRSVAYLAVLLPIVLVATLLSFRAFSEQSQRGGGGLIQSNLFQFDFSDYISLESEISLNDDLVLLYRREGRAERELVRRYVMSGYDRQRGFYLDLEREPQAIRVPDGPADLPGESSRGRERLEQEYFVVNFDPSSLIARAEPRMVQPVRNWADSSFLRVYRVESEVSVAKPTELRSAGEDLRGREWLEYYTYYGDDGRIRDLAQEVVAGIEGRHKQVEAVLRHLKGEYYYSLSPGLAVDGNQLHHFLFGSKKGYCSYFAFSMALMLRSLGIPARVAVGFFVDERSEVLNVYPVRANQAHAWTEVYFEGYGWIEFDRPPRP